MEEKDGLELQDLDLGDIGLDMSDLDLGDVNLTPISDTEETRYIKPKVAVTKSNYICYDNAEALAKELWLDFGARFDAFVSGNFVFGDFIEAFMVAHNIHTPRLVISTLSLSQDNVDSLANLLEGGFVDELDLIVSAYFWGNERKALIPYIYKTLDKGNRFQLAVAGIHTKTCQFTTDGGRKVVIHGSANLRSSGNIEQFTIEESPELYDFYKEKYDLIISKYATIQKAIRGNDLWDTINNTNK